MQAKKKPKADPNRKHIRFNADSGDIAWLEGKVPGLIVNESYTGCSLIIVGGSDVQKGDILHVKVGKLKTMESEVRWVKKIDKDVFRIGLLYKD